MNLSLNTTITAIASASGIGAIANIRISGPLAFDCADAIFQAKSNKSLHQLASRKLYFGTISYQDNLIDEVMLVRFNAPYSYTGEDSVEIHCHASPFIQSQILHALLEVGCTLAAPGQFTQRAFLNGKLDLVQAESVADLIAASSAAEHRMALSQMKGNLSAHLNHLRQDLLDFASLIELELDFSEEDVEFADRIALTKKATEIQSYVNQLAQTFKAGNALKNGVPVAIIGATNAGKSTLLNQLLQDDRAIVSPIPGTTRDFIEDTCQIKGINFRFIDTAGIRTTSDEVETMGIERTFLKLDQSDIILWLIDAQLSVANAFLDASVLNRVRTAAEHKKLLIVFNKLDLLEDPDHQIDLLKAGLEKLNLGSYQWMIISAKVGTSCKELEEKLLHLSQLEASSASNLIVTNVRHFNALCAANIALEQVIAGLNTQLSGDLLALDLKQAIYHLSDIVGEVSSQDILNNIFSKFCIGK